MSSELQSQLSSYFAQKPVIRAFIFGSFARGEENDLSDIDFYIELDPDVPIGMEFVHMYLDLKEITGREVDLVTPKSISIYVKQHIEKEMILIYEKQAA